MLFNDLASDPEPQARSVHLLGGEERFEDFSKPFARDARAGIRDGEARSAFAGAGEAELDPATLRRRIHRIGEQVGDDLLDLAAEGHDAAAAAIAPLHRDPSGAQPGLEE